MPSQHSKQRSGIWPLSRRDFLRTACASLAVPLMTLPIIRTGGKEVILIRNGRIIDGTGREPLPRASILIENGRFKEITEGKINPPAGAVVLDAAGKTVLPGLVDMHAHLLSGGFDTITDRSMSYDVADQKRALKQMLYWGVTSVFDPVQPLESGLHLRAQVAAQAFPSPRLFISGPGFTAPGGWGGATHPDARFEPKDVHDVRRQVAQLAEAKVDAVKVFYDDMSCAFVHQLPKLAKPLMRSVIQEAHARNLKVMVHAYETEDQKEALRAGADMMAHSAVTAPVDEKYIALAKKNEALYLATLSVYHDVFNKKTIRDFIKQDFVRKTVPQKTLVTLAENGPLDAFEQAIKHDYFKTQLPTIMANLKKVFEGGVAIGVGPDTGVPGAFPGIAVHREMELMVQDGVPAASVIVAATKTGAEYLGQPLLGTIERGKRADLIILTGDPLKDIKETRTIDVVMKDGRIIDREKLLKDILAA